jgi:hypothetical protein
MALVQKNTLSELATNARDDFFNQRFTAGEEVPHSGIYKCTKCNREATVNAHSSDNTFPPHYPESPCKSPIWKPYVMTDTKAEW